MEGEENGICLQISSFSNYSFETAKCYFGHGYKEREKEESL
jgi:hypothetical protein